MISRDPTAPTDRARPERASRGFLSRSEARPALGFLAAWLLLDTMVNLRYPAPEPALWFLLPSLDIVVVFGCMAGVAALGHRVPTAVRIALVAALVLVRLLRFGDGALGVYYSVPFHLHIDLALLPELIRFAYSTLGFAKATLCCAAALGLLCGVCLACHFALLHAERYLAEPRHLRLVALVALLSMTGATVGKLDGQHGELHHLGLGASVVPRLVREAGVLFHARTARADHADEIARVRQQLDAQPKNLARLDQRDVYLFLVESYGATVLERPLYLEAIAPVYAAFETELGAGGFAMASGLLDSPIAGGRSWLAHATLGSGVRTENQLQYDVALDLRPRGVASLFRDAGYRTVLVQPGTTRPSPRTEFYGFEQSYYARDLEYRGPSYAWATMPDQYVIDFVHRREVAPRSSPLFVQYTLVTSHAPWSDLPPLVDDWGALGDGSIYEQLGRRQYQIEWPRFQNAPQAYIDSIVYDLMLLERYLREFVQGEALVVILGDHQPVAEVAGYSTSRAVPVHVLSRHAPSIEPFVARGYTRGMRPATTAGPRRGLETLLPDLVRDFSTPESAHTD